MLDEASREARNELIDDYLEAVDAEEFERYREMFAEDVTYAAMGQTIEGIDAMIEWYENSLVLSDMFHDYPNRIHDETGSVAFGEFGGTVPGGEEMSARAIDLFEFDEDNTEITKMVVYTALPPQM
jgi:ketosteroid isomerase-like protein